MYCEGLWLKSQAGLSHLSEAGAEFTYQAKAMNQARVPGGTDRAYGAESGLVDGVYERPTYGWPQLVDLQYYRPLQP